MSRIRIRVIIYGYGALLALGIVLFPRQWWAVLIPWFVVGIGSMAWWTTRLRRAFPMGSLASPIRKSNEQLLRRIIPSLIAGGSASLLLGVTAMTLLQGGLTTTHIVVGSLLLGFGAITLTWAAILRFRLPSRDS